MTGEHKNLNSPLLVVIVVIVLLITLDLFLKSRGRGGDFARDAVRGEGMRESQAPPPHHPLLICMHSIEMIINVCTTSTN